MLRIKSRDVHFEKSCGGLLDCSFDELCARPLWTNDYLKLTQVILFFSGICIELGECSFLVFFFQSGLHKKNMNTRIWQIVFVF
jgi:hypothetical protein